MDPEKRALFDELTDVVDRKAQEMGLLLDDLVEFHILKFSMMGACLLMPSERVRTLLDSAYDEFKRHKRRLDSSTSRGGL